MPSRVPTVRISTETDLVTVVPYLLGFRPDDGSLVVLAFADNVVVFGVRSDLPGPDDDVDDLGAYLADVTQRAHPNSTVVFVGYGVADQVDPVLRTVVDVFIAKGLPVRPPLRVSGNHVFHVACDDPGCPSGGFLFDPLSSPVAAEATFAGAVALPNRAAKAALVTSIDTASSDEMKQAVSRARTRLQPMIDDDTTVEEGADTAIAAAVSSHAAGVSPSADELAWLVVLLTRPSVFEAAVDHTGPDERLLAFWAEITRRAPEDLVAAPATLLAATAWQVGDGMIAALAAERALQADPASDLARVIRYAVHLGIGPAEVPRSISTGEPRN